MDAREATSRVEGMFSRRTEYESLWETAYKYIAPERALIYTRDKRTPNEIQDEVFDSTAIDSAERLTNLIVSGLVPPWQRWFRVSPGSGVPSIEDREALRPALQVIEDNMFSLLSRSNFYQEMQPAILDRIVGGTGAIMMKPDKDNQRLRFKCVPLGELAIDEDDGGNIVSVARKFKLSIKQMIKAYGNKVPKELRDISGEKQGKPDQDIIALNDETASGLWYYAVIHKGTGAKLEEKTTKNPVFFVSRWSKVPGSVYGRGPGLRALSDVRALNKIKELQLKNAAKAVAGIYTVVDDGVVNPYTLTFEPGTFMPVGSNDRQNPTIAELPATGNFDVSLFTIEDLRNSILGTFMADNYGPLDRTPMTATEVQARTRIIAQDMGATISRMQQEMLFPIIRAVYSFMAELDLAPEELDLNDEGLQLEFVSQLAQAQQAVDEQNLLEFTQTAVSFGQVDPKAGLIIDVHKALGKLAEIKHISPQVLRTQQEITQLQQQAAQVQAQEEQQMGAADGME